MSSSSDAKKAVSPVERLAQLRARIAKAPEQPGIYRWMDAEGTILYVGKAKNLRKRLKSYVSSKNAAGPWRQSFLKQIADFDVSVTNTEIEALIFETNLIKQLRPKYNVLMKDDKNYVYARVTVQDFYPRIEAVRRIDPNDAAKYFGPMSTGGELWTALTMLRKIFPFRTCKMEIEPSEPQIPNSESRIPNPEPATSNQQPATTLPNPELRIPNPSSRIPIEVICKHKDRPTPCLDHHIGKCVAPCIGTMTPEEYYKECIEGVINFLKGDYESVEKVLKDRMAKAAADRKFELAAQFRDHLLTLDRTKQRQIITDTTGEDTDIVAVAVLSGRAHVVVMRRRGGRLIGDTGMSLAGQAESEEEVLEQFLPQYYADGQDIPDMILVSEKFPDTDVFEAWLSEKKGKKVRIVLPERGRKSHLLQLAEKNVQEKARAEEVKWEMEKRNTEHALDALQQLLTLSALPKRIEGYDISHLGGTETVGSMVVLQDGKSKNDHYRSFTIRTLKEGTVDDYKSLQEVLKRRLHRLTEDLPAEEKIWKERGVIAGKAHKEECEALAAILKSCPAEGGGEPAAHTECFVARREKEVVAVVRAQELSKDTLLISCVWTAVPEERSTLGTFMLRKYLRSLKKGKVYTLVEPDQEDVYGELGFRYVQRIPPTLVERMERWRVSRPDQPEPVALVFEVRQNKIDPSLSARPDLIVIDGGKGQLSSVVEVMQKMKIDIPVIGLAKREEEVFVPGSSDPIYFPADSSAKFLLMRLRDEAHRFANRHREARNKKHAKSSALDDVPGIGELTKKKLMKRFGSVEGIRTATDDELREIVGALQVQQLRKSL